MDQRTTPLARIKPLPADHSPELKEQFEAMRKNLGFIPNSILIMQRKPKLAKALAQMTAAVWDPEGEVDRGFKRIIAHVASRAAGCRYCMAHTAGGALHFQSVKRELEDAQGLLKMAAPHVVCPAEQLGIRLVKRRL